VVSLDFLASAANNGGISRQLEHDGPRIDAVAALRTATQALHEQLDHSLPLARADAHLADYAAHLTVLRDWQRALAPWLSRAIIDPTALALLEQDLSDCPAPVCALAALPALPLPDLTALRQVDDGRDGFCWGIAYVVEGSRLGGQVLYRRLSQQLAPHPLRYLGQRGRAGASWPETLACLRIHLDARPELESACHGAVAAFELLVLRFRHAGCLV
jgi:heme oxygenase